MGVVVDAGHPVFGAGPHYAAAVADAGPHKLLLYVDGNLVRALRRSSSVQLEGGRKHATPAGVARSRWSHPPPPP